MEPHDSNSPHEPLEGAGSNPTAFDPYYTWLGIPPHQQPADHYRLLGVQPFEGNVDVISHALDQRLAYVRTFQNGRRGDLSQTILNELALAGTCLLDPASRRRYDAALRSERKAEATAAASAKPAPAPRRPPRKAESPAATSGNKPPSRRPAPSAPDFPRSTPAGSSSAGASVGVTTSPLAGRRPLATRRDSSGGRSMLMWTAIVVVATGGLAALVAVLNNPGPVGQGQRPEDPLDGVRVSDSVVASSPSAVEPVSPRANHGEQTAHGESLDDGRPHSPDLYPSDQAVAGEPGAAIQSPAGDGEAGHAEDATSPRVRSSDGAGGVREQDPPAAAPNDRPPARDELLAGSPWATDNPSEPTTPTDDVRQPGEETPAADSGIGVKSSPLLTLAELRAAQAAAHQMVDAQWKLAEQPFQKLEIGWKLLRQARDKQLRDVERAGLYAEAFDILRQSAGFSLALPIAWEAAAEAPIPIEAWLPEQLREEAKRARPAERLEIAQLLWLHARQAAESGRWEMAADAAQMAASQASRGPADFKRLAVALRSFLDQHERALDQARRAEQALQAGRDDASARCLVAKTMCLLRDRWETGLPLLAEVEPKEYAQAAQAELSAPAQPVEQVALGDRWWNLADSEEAPWSDAARRRAVHWYERAAPLLAGLEAQRVTARIDQTAAPQTGLTQAAEEAQRRWQAMGLSSARLAGRLLIDQRDVGTRVEYEPGVGFSGAAVVDFLQTKGVAAGSLAVSLSGTLELAEPTRLGFVVSGGAPGGGVQWSIDGRPILAAESLTAEAHEVWLTAGQHQLTWTLAGPNLGECRLLLFDARTGMLPAIAAGTAVRPGAAPARQRIQIARQAPN